LYHVFIIVQAIQSLSDGIRRLWIEFLLSFRLLFMVHLYYIRFAAKHKRNLVQTLTLKSWSDFFLEILLIRNTKISYAKSGIDFSK